jgi:alpha-tubulin suppressor-like RCC1 family protein
MKRRFILAVALPALGLVVVLMLLSGFLSRPGPQTNWKLPVGKRRPMVAIGDGYGVILASDGSLWTWGADELGWHVLGLGPKITREAGLHRIGTATDWVDVAVGGSTILALKADGTLRAWGENVSGQLGDGSWARERAAPVRSVPGNDWKAVATAGPHSVALKRDGTLWSWGNNWAGQLGDGTTNSSRVPVRVGSSTNWIRIWANLIENVGQQSDGSLWFWGWDYTRSCPQGASTPVPTRVAPDTNWVDVAMGDWMVFAIKADGTLWAWGRLAHIFTGAAHPSADSSPVRVGTDSDWRACASFAQSRPLFMKLDGSLWVLDGSDQRGVACVSAIVAGLVTNNALALVADSTTLGGDPAVGVVKSLQITFRLGGKKQTLDFRENSAVRLGAKGQTLSILRALYGDPRMFGVAAGLAPRTFLCAPARLRRISVPKNVVAFCGGRHGLGVAVTSDGEVWTWGEALGRQTRPIHTLQVCSRVLNRLGVPVRWGEPRPVVYKEPTRLRADPMSSGK